jgi:hypothetical protein
MIRFVDEKTRLTALIPCCNAATRGICDLCANAREETANEKYFSVDGLGMTLACLPLEEYGASASGQQGARP